MKTKKQLISLLATVAVMWAFTPMISAQKPAKRLSGSESEGFNAMEHVLQKPLANPEFPEEENGFVKNIFVGVNGGGSWINSLSASSIVPGYHAGVHFGGWFSPVNGLQFTISSGKHSIHKYVPYAYFASIKGDYLVNLTSLMRGYKPNRRFELIGSVGAVYQRTLQLGKFGNNYGGATSLMFKYNAGKHSYFFAQPELTLLGGLRYNTVSPRFRFMSNMAINVGVGSRLYVGERRLLESVKFEQQNEDNFYFGAGGGLFDSFPHSYGSFSPMGNAFIGKVLSPYSSVQFGARLGSVKGQDKIGDHYIGVGSLDYVLNITNLFTGYHDNNPIQLSANAGVSAGAVYQDNTIYKNDANSRYKYYAGVQGGLIAQYNLSDNFGIYVHPQLYLFPDGYKTAMQAVDRSMVSVDLGVKYTVGHYSRDNRAGALESKPVEFGEDDKYWFAQATYGRGSHGKDFGWYTKNYAASFGHRFTAISSWRVNADGVFFPLYKRGTVGADYMADMITPIMGYNPDRAFGLQATMGALIGMSDFENTQLATGVKGGLSASLRLWDKLHLVLEPEVLILRDAINAAPGRKWTPETRISAGLRYNFAAGSNKAGAASLTAEENRRRAALKFEQANEDNFYFGIGGGLFDSFPHGFGSFSPMGSAFVGKVLSPYSSVQFGARMANVKGQTKLGDHYAGIASLDYVLNLSNLVAGYNNANHLQFAANAGVSAGVVYRDNAVYNADVNSRYNYYAGVKTGLIAQYNLSDNFGIYLHPQVYLFPDGYKTAMNAVDRSMVSVDLGLKYTIGHYTRDNREGLLGSKPVEFNDAHKYWFAQATYGRGTHGKSLSLFTNSFVASLGHRFTAISSWRVNAEGLFFPLYKRGTVGADYMADMITPIVGYNPDRAFGLQATMGALVGVCDFENTQLATGVKGGLSASLRLWDNLNLVLEPEVMILRDAIDGGDGRKLTPEARVSVGLQYNFK